MSAGPRCRLPSRDLPCGGVPRSIARCRLATLSLPFSSPCATRHAQYHGPLQRRSRFFGQRVPRAMQRRAPHPQGSAARLPRRACHPRSHGGASRGRVTSGFTPPRRGVGRRRRRYEECRLNSWTRTASCTCRGTGRNPAAGSRLVAPGLRPPVWLAPNLSVLGERESSKRRRACDACRPRSFARYAGSRTRRRDGR